MLQIAQSINILIMGKQIKHDQSNHEANNHKEHATQHPAHHAHTPADPFTHHERVLIQMANKNQQRFGTHAHHHHHSHVQFRRPHNLNTNLGLFSLKKLNAMNPDILRQQDKRLLLPSAPGVITHLIYGSILLTTTVYGLSAWRNYGLKFLVKPKIVAPLLILTGVNICFQQVANRCRQLTFAPARSRMVEYYKNVYGQKFLLDILEPTFRLPESLESK